MFDKTAPKGMRDILPQDLFLREQILDTIKKVYRSFGFLGIETPCVEDLALLTSKQGGDNEKLIFKILKRGDKLESADKDDLCDLGLRYDLTVPLTRYFANNQGKLPAVFKAMQIGNVWRAERPQKGRFRQFIQCDIDIIGEDTFLAETELITATSKALSELGITKFVVRVNDRRLLSSFAEICGYEKREHESVFIALDKLDKIGIDGVRVDLLSINADQAKADKFVQLIDTVMHSADPFTEINTINPEAAENLKKIIEVTGQTAADCKVVFDASLVRGMNYYTGTIFEVSYGDFGASIAGGGRYDEMLSKFLGEKVPACGFSIGFERICAILAEQGTQAYQPKEKVAYIVDKNISTQDLIAAVGECQKQRQNGKDCLLVKRIKNFGYLIKQLQEQGYAELYMFADGTARPIE